MLESRINAQKPNKNTHQYATMATAESISIFLYMVWVNMFAYDHNLLQDQIGEKDVLGHHTSLMLYASAPGTNYIQAF